VTIPSDITRKIGQYVLVALSSDKGGEVAAAMSAVRRALDSAGVSIHTFADSIKNPGAGNNSSSSSLTYTKQDVLDAFKRGQLEERKAQDARAQRASNDETSLAAMAGFLEERINRVSERHHGFIKDMARQTARGYELSERQQSYLESLYHQHGGL
jgi:hypothetical protein